MKKIILPIILLFSLILSAGPFDDEIEAERLSIRKAIYNNVLNENTSITADVVSADIFLAELSNSRIKLNSANLIFPDVKSIRNHIEEFSEHINNKIVIYLLKHKSNAFKMENRSYEELLKIMSLEKLKKVKKLTIITLDIPEIEQKNIYTDSFIKGMFKKTKIYKKYIQGE